jgi:hypothetical protein
VKFTSLELMAIQAFITAQVASNKVIYSIGLTKVNNPLSHEEVEGYFESELSKESSDIELGRCHCTMKVLS